MIAFLVAVNCLSYTNLSSIHFYFPTFCFMLSSRTTAPKGMMFMSAYGESPLTGRPIRTLNRRASRDLYPLRAAYQNAPKTS